jgi:hypothetical protein
MRRLQLVHCRLMIRSYSIYEDVKIKFLDKPKKIVIAKCESLISHIAPWSFNPFHGLNNCIL